MRVLPEALPNADRESTGCRDQLGTVWRLLGEAGYRSTLNRFNETHSQESSRTDLLHSARKKQPDVTV
jgi:hypothetical protein